MLPLSKKEAKPKQKNPIEKEDAIPSKVEKKKRKKMVPRRTEIKTNKSKMAITLTKISNTALKGLMGVETITRETITTLTIKKN
jgi:hypothetical protein